MTPLENLIAWCKQERESLTDQKKLMEEGKLRILSRTLGASEQDVTAENIKGCERKLRELNDIICRHPEIK